MNVLSLFDGMSCGQIALNKLGIKIGRENLSNSAKEILEEAYARLGTLKAVSRELKIDPDSVKHYMEYNSLNPVMGDMESPEVVQ